MSSKTTNYNLNKIDLTDSPPDITVLNSNFDTIDTQMKATDTKAEGKISHSLATAVNDFLVASVAGQFVKKTLAEVKAILGLGSAAYTASTTYATAAQGAKADVSLPSASYTASDILTKLKTVDGSGSGLDADTVDGLATGNATGNLPISNGTVCANLNADKLDGNDASAFATAAQGTKADNAMPASQKGVAGGVALYDDVNAHMADYVRQPGAGTTTGSANTYALSLNPTPTSYIDNMGIVLKINIDNTSTSTINVNNLGVKPLKNPDGSNLEAGDLKAGSIYTFRYNATTGNFILQGKGGGSDKEVKKSFTLVGDTNVVPGNVVEFAEGGVQKTKALSVGGTGVSKLLETSAYERTESKILVLSPTRILVYLSSLNYGGSKPTIQLWKVDNCDLTLLSSVILNETSVKKGFMVQYDATRVVIAVTDNSSTSTGGTDSVKLAVVTITNDVLSISATYPTLSTGGDEEVVAFSKLEGNRFVALTQASYCCVYVFNFDVNTLAITTSVRTQVAVSTGFSAFCVALYVLSPTRILVAHSESTSSTYGYIRLYSVDANNVITLLNSASKYNMNSSDRMLVGYWWYILQLTPTRFALASGRSIRLFDLVGDVLTLIGAIVISPQTGDFGHVHMESPTRLIMDVRDNTVPTELYMNIATISGDTVTISASTQMTSYEVNGYYSLERLEAEKYLAIYQVTPSSYALFLGSYPTFSNLVTLPQKSQGVAAGSAVVGNNVTVMLKGIVSPLSGLTPGALYYVNTSGNLSATPDYKEIGVALSTTELLASRGEFSDIVGNKNLTNVKKSFAGTCTIGKVVNVISSGNIQDYAGTGYGIGVYQGGGVVILKGISNVHSGLIVGSRYYYDNTGAVTPIASGNKYLGIALNSTALMIPDFIN